MEISGSLLKKNIEFYTPKLTSFDNTSCETIDLILTYNCELMPLPWYEEKIQKLALKQEKHILYLIDLIKRDIKNLPSPTKNNINKLLDIIYNTPRRYTCLLLEYLNKLLNQEQVIYRLEEQIKNFFLLVNYLEKENILKTIDINTTLGLATKKRPYDKDALEQFKITNYHIVEKDLSPKSKMIYEYGLFIAPQRLKNIANALLKEEELIDIIAPIYLSISEYNIAYQFLRKASNCLTYNEIRKEAQLLRVPKNIIDLV